MTFGRTERPLTLVNLRDRPALLPRAAAWFSEKWAVPRQAYADSMQACLAQGAGVPQWYVVLYEGRDIIAGAGVIENDFHSRKDLAPNLCALFVEEPWRGRGIARALLQAVRRDMAAAGVAPLYLVTDHTSFYERCGWRFVTLAADENTGEAIRVYKSPEDKIGI